MDGEREIDRHLYCRQGRSDGRKSKAAESIRALSGVLVSRLPCSFADIRYTKAAYGSSREIIHT